MIQTKVELSINADLFSYLHKSFTWILKKTRERLKECFQLGSPLEDEVVKKEASVEPENRFNNKSLIEVFPNNSSFKSLRDVRQVYILFYKTLIS